MAACALAATAAGLALLGAAAPGWAANPHLDVVRTAADTMHVDFVFFSIDYHADIVAGPGDWNTPEFQGEIAGLGTPDFSELFSEGGFWVDPNASAGLAHLNLIPSGNRGSTSVDINLDGNPPPFAQGGQCDVNGVGVPCPIFANGQTWAAPYTAQGRGGGTIDITFTDRTLGTPEPAAWSLMIAGFGLAGATLRRRGAAAA
jgi:hypothetical protein